MAKILVSASILAANFAELAKEIKAVSAAGADMIHLDIMDGNFVPSITFGCEVIKSLRTHSKLPFDTHLMVNQPETKLQAFAQAGCDILTFHAEASIHIDRTIKQILSYGKKAGLALVPSTSESVLEYVIDQLDYILVMTVNPGYAGQEFMSEQLEKVARIKRMIEERKLSTMLAVDGGVNPDTAKKCIAAGANVIVAAKAIFSTPDYQKAIAGLKC